MENFNTKEIIAIVFKNKKAIIIVTLLAAVASTVVSYLLKPKFKSYAVVYPVNLSPSSEESNTEQLLQYFNSEEVKQAVAKKHNLYKHYEVDPKSNGAKSLFDLYFKSNVSVSPTLYESLEITVKDESPEMARDIAQSMIDETNNLILTIKKERLQEYILNNQREFKTASAKVDSLQRMINDVRNEYNIVDFRYQSKYLTKDLHEGKNMNDMNKKTLNGLKTKESELTRLGNVYGSQIGTFNYFRNEIDKYMLDFNSKISFTNIVSKPTLPDKKFFPVRWLIVSISTLSAFALAAIFFILSNKSVRKVD